MTQTPSSISVVVADDHPIVREGLAKIISGANDMECLYQASGVEDVIKAWAKYTPDVGIFDLRMGDGDAVSAITRIRSDFPNARILVVSSFDGDEEIYRVIKSGARGYLLKESQPEIILDAVRVLHAGRRYLPTELSSKLADRVVTTDLSQREIDILQSAATGNSNAQIAKEQAISVSTVKFHLANAFMKLGVNSRTAAISSAMKRGIIQMD